MSGIKKHWRLWLSLFMLMVFYGVGFWGFSGNHPMEFARLTWVNLLVSCFFVFFPMEKPTGKEMLVMISVFVLGFTVEVVGVMTGALFGEYHYGSNLGVKLYEVPLVIGLNWLMLVYASQAVAASVFSHWLLVAFTGAILMTGMDFLIEPVAIKLDYWQWKDGIIPNRNFIWWFIFGFIFQVMMVKAFRVNRNPAAIVLFILQAALFVYIGKTV